MGRYVYKKNKHQCKNDQQMGKILKKPSFFWNKHQSLLSGGHRTLASPTLRTANFVGEGVGISHLWGSSIFARGPGP